MINEKIKKLREKNNLTQKELAKSLGLHRNSLSFYESGVRFPTQK